MRSMVLATCVLLMGPAFAQVMSTSSQPMTSAEAVQLIRDLEKAPLAEGARAVRSDLIAWAQETNDVTIMVCDVLGPVPGSEVPYGPELLVQSMFGNGAFQLEHPESKGDQVKVQLAGIESMLRAYREIIKADPGGRIPEFDIWVRDLESGALADRVTPSIQEKCLAPPAKA